MRLTQNWEVRKPGASSRGGIVVAQNTAAAEVGAQILAAGGGAVDAVVATALALAALEPWSSGLGGTGFMVAHPAGAHQAEVVNFGPIAPRTLDAAAYPLTGATRTELFTWPRVAGDRNMRGPLSFAIPSAVAGYGLAIERFGRMPWRDLAAPAVGLARAGLPVDWFVTLKVANAAADLRSYDETRRIWLPNGLPPVCPADGDAPRLKLGRLPETLERLAAAGPGDFYRGEIAHSIVGDLREAGAFLTAEDLSLCRARIVPALRDPLSRCAVPGSTRHERRADARAHSVEAERAAFCREPRRGLFCGSRRGAAPGLCGSTGALRRCRGDSTHLDEPHRSDRPRRRDRGADDDFAIAFRQSSHAARQRNPNEQRNHVVRSTPRAAEFDRPREARIDQHVSGRRGPRRATLARLGRLGGSAHPRRGAAVGELRHRFRHEFRRPPHTTRASM